ncbi:MAG: hypothetical protein Fur0010_24220 [Bdellovibrio sp.]
MANKNFGKVKLTERIQNIISSYLRTGLSDSRLQFVSITRVELNRDSSVATVHWDTFDSSKRGDAKKALESASAKIRSHLANILERRSVPQINFFYDSQYEDEAKIDQLLKSDASETDEE